LLAISLRYCQLIFEYFVHNNTQKALFFAFLNIRPSPHVRMNFELFFFVIKRLCLENYSKSCLICYMMHDPLDA
jgi:hypothetical protein